MTLPQLIIPVLIAAATPVADTPTTAAPAATSLAVAAPVADVPPPAKLEFPLEGYRINAFDSSTKGFFNFSMSLPGHPLCSVNVDSAPPMGEPSGQAVVMDATRFHAKSGYTILSERTPSPKELQVEYTAQYDKTTPKEHTYTRMLYANGKFYGVSATAPDADWKNVESLLKACVDSFEFSPDPAPGKIVFPQQGFRISKLDGPLPAGVQQRLLSMELHPLSMGRPPPPLGVNVGIEPYAKTLKDYQAERKPPFMIDSKDKFKILKESAPAENTLVTEYSEGGLISYEKVVLAHGQLYRAWIFSIDETSAQSKALVESLEVMPIPAPAK